MTKRLLLIVMMTQCLAYSQGARFDIPPILGPTGQPLPNIAVTLCLGTGSISGTSCSPQAQSFTDITLGVPCALGAPVTLTATTACQSTSDSFGNAGFWLSPGAYIYCLTGRGIAGSCYNLTVAAGSTPSGTLRSGPITAAGQVTVPDGSFTAPGLRFNGNNSGLFNVAGSVVTSINGTQGPFFNSNVNLAANSSCYTLGASQDTSVGRGAAGQVTIGNGTCGDTSGTVKSSTVNALTGFQVNGTALAASNLSNGVTGSGAVVLATSPAIASPTLTTPNIGSATGSTITSTSQFLAADGTAAAPSHSFTSNTGTGLFRDSPSNTIGVSFGGTRNYFFQGNSSGQGTFGLGILQTIGWAPTADPLNSRDTGISRTAAATVGIGNGNQGDTTGSIALGGTNPAQSGAIRLANNTNIVWRNSANNADLTGIQGTAGNTMLFGFNGEMLTSGTLTTQVATVPRFNFGALSANALEARSDGIYGFSSNTTPTGSMDTGMSRLGAGSVAIGNGTQGDTSGTLKATTVNAVAGFQVNGTALAASHLSNGTTGSGAVVLATSPSLTTPNIGSATGTTINATAGFQVNGTALAASNLSNGTTGTGAVVLANSPTLTNLTLNSPTLVTPNIGAASGNTLTFATQAAPANPPSGSITIYGDSTGNLTCRNNSGGSCFSATAAAPFLSNSANPAVTGVLRAASGDTAVAFRNNANNGDIAALAKNSSDVVVVGGPTGIQSNMLQATGSGGLPASCGGGALFINDVTSPNSADICFGDGTGWTFNLTKRSSSTSTSVFSVKDTGVVNAASGYQVNGSALSASNLSNGVTGSGAVVLQNSPTLGGTATVNALQTNGASPAQSGVYRCSGNQACAVARTPDNTTDVQLGFALNGPRVVFGSVGGSTASVTAELGGLQVDTGVKAGSGLAHFRSSGTSCTTPAAAGATCNTTISLPVTAPDTNYTVICSLEGSNVNTPVVIGTGAKTTTTFTLAIAGFGAASSYNTADCIYLHD